MPKAYINIDIKVSYDQAMTIEAFTDKMAALFDHGTIVDAFDAAGFTLEDFTLRYAETDGYAQIPEED